jgi:hypothetical protein
VGIRSNDDADARRLVGDKLPPLSSTSGFKASSAAAKNTVAAVLGRFVCETKLNGR